MLGRDEWLPVELRLGEKGEERLKEARERERDEREGGGPARLARDRFERVEDRRLRGLDCGSSDSGRVKSHSASSNVSARGVVSRLLGRDLIDGERDTTNDDEDDEGLGADRIESSEMPSEIDQGTSR